MNEDELNFQYDNLEICYLEYQILDKLLLIPIIYFTAIINEYQIKSFFIHCN